MGRQCCPGVELDWTFQGRWSQKSVTLVLTVGLLSDASCLGQRCEDTVGRAQVELKAGSVVEGRNLERSRSDLPGEEWKL